MANRYLRQLFLTCILLSAEKAGAGTGLAATTTLPARIQLIHFPPGRGINPSDTFLTGAKSKKQKAVTFEYSLLPGENALDKIKKNLFIKVKLDKPTYWQHEMVLATYRLYSRVVEDSRILKQPVLQDFALFTMDSLPTSGYTVEYIAPYYYRVKTIQKIQLIPFATGRLQIDAAEIESVIHFIQKSTRPVDARVSIDGLLNQIEEEESLPRVDQKVTLASPVVAVDVNPLPAAGRPVNFSGAVGKFSVLDSLAKKEIPAGEMNTLELVIMGSGYLPVIDTPVVEWPLGVRLFSVKSAEQYDEKSIYMNGSKRFIYSFSADNEGKYLIPSVQFSYFDPAANVYKKIQTNETFFQVTKNNNVKNLSPGENSLLQDKKRATTIQSYLRNHAPWIAATCITLLFLTYFLVRNSRQKKEIKNLHQVINSGEQKKEEGKQQSDPLSHARELLAEEEIKDFLKELNRVLLGILSTRLNIPFSELNRENIMKVLLSNGSSRELAEEIEEVLNVCQENLYMPESVHESVNYLLQKAERLIVDITNGKREEEN